MIRSNWWMVLGTGLLAGALSGCGTVDAVDGDDDSEGQQVRISNRFEITVPTADTWAGLLDVNPNVLGSQVRVEVHAFYHVNNTWANHGGERWTQYQIRTTGEENVRGVPRVLASAGQGVFRGVDGAFVIDNAIYLVGYATGGNRVVSGPAHTFNTRNEKPVIVGVRFNGRAASDSLVTVANQESLATFTFAPSGGQRVFDMPQFSQRWVDAGNEPFACFNINNTAGQFVTGTSPTDFRSASRGFVLNGNLYALGQATGGAAAVTGGYNAVAPRRALANYNAGSGTVTYGVSVRTLPE
ncbi:MAG: hypothetical protein U0324_32790 [Polyangiales bacterium]